MVSLSINFRFTSIILPLIFLTACGGGGSSSSSVAENLQAATATTTTESVLVKRGPVSGFGSVFVNGERFETDSDTEFRKGDDVSSESALRIGMIVKVRSRKKNSAGEWIAENIEFDEDVKGPLDEINGNVLIVVGQTVNVTDDTRLDDGLTLGDLVPGDILEVSGHRVANDEIDALFIERKLFGEVNKYEVLGQVRDHDPEAMRFRIGGLSVNYALAELDDLDGGISNDLLVEVEDENKAYVAGSKILDATEVEGENRFEFADDDANDIDEDADEFEIEGVISEIVDANSFRLAELLVSHDAGTEFLFGDALDLAVGTKVQVDGDMTAGGLHARKIKFQDNSARVAGRVNSVVGSVVTVMGIPVDVVIGTTELEDDRDDVEPFGLADIVAGEDFVEVRGAQFGNRIRASELERDDDNDDSELRGTVDAFDETAATVTLFGHLLITDSATQYRDDDDDDGMEDGVEAVLTAQEFFARLHENQTIVQAKWDGVVADLLLPVRELSLED